jgi:hypothetical protein
MGVADLRHAPASSLLGKTVGIHCTGGWVGSRTDLEGRGKPPLNRDSIPAPSIHPVASRYTARAIPTCHPFKESNQMPENIHKARENTRFSIAYVPQCDAG